MIKRRRRRKPRLRHPVCKPCWELKYCPYGPLVEYFPLYPEEQSLVQIRRLHTDVRHFLAAGGRRNDLTLRRTIQTFLYSDPQAWVWIKEFDTAELGCNVFGHICPVFFKAEPFTETKEGRRIGRSIPRKIMLQVVRRDGQICQMCNAPVRDDEVEIDHLIPLSRGGPVTADNLRLVCRNCNRTKGDTLSKILSVPPPCGGERTNK